MTQAKVPRGSLKVAEYEAAMAAYYFDVRELQRV
jgi:hypothetical protein